MSRFLQSQQPLRPSSPLGSPKGGQGIRFVNPGRCVLVQPPPSAQQGDPNSPVYQQTVTQFPNQIVRQSSGVHSSVHVAHYSKAPVEEEKPTTPEVSPESPSSQVSELPPETPRKSKRKHGSSSSSSVEGPPEAGSGVQMVVTEYEAQLIYRMRQQHSKSQMELVDRLATKMTPKKSWFGGGGGKK